MSGHTLVITDDSITLEHPDACASGRGCKEAEYVDRYGFESWAIWPSGRYPVAWWGGWYGTEWNEGLGEVYPDVDWDADYRFTPTPNPVGLLRGDISQPRRSAS